MKVLKFGGSSVAHDENISNVVKIITKISEKTPCVVVVSACGNTTNQLLELPALALESPEEALSRIEDIIDNHCNWATKLLSRERTLAFETVAADVKQSLQNIIKGVSLIEEVTPRARDVIGSKGEELSSHLLTLALKEQGLEAEHLDARSCIIADPPYESGIVRRQQSYARIHELLSISTGIRVVPGFVAATAEGHTITLGRGGSDYSAALIGAALSAEAIEIWTDVDGLMTADPSKVSRAFCQKEVTYEEAMELSHFGARVIYPPTIQPAIEKKIPLYIKNTFNPTWSGSKIHESVCEKRSVTGISSIAEVALLRIQGSGMVGVTGISSRVFGALARENISVILITQASSEHTICFAVLPAHTDAAVAALQQEFEYERYRNLIDDPIVEDSVSIVSIIGEQMRQTTGVAARTFTALSANGINVIAIAQGSSERNISAVIQHRDEEKAIRALHEEFFYPERRFINVFLCGTGLIGTALLDQIASHGDTLSKELHHEIRVIGVTNSRTMLFDENGIDYKDIKQRLTTENSPASFERFLESMYRSTVPNKVFVDCTASSDVSASYASILAQSIHVVTPNKRAQTATFEAYKHMHTTAMRKGVMLLWETSVGAGLPVINTLNDLLKSGDTVTRIEAVLSGTLSYLFNSFDGSLPFSTLVNNAQKQGYTEPDPRDDLNGMDVARKILILAREVGAELELSDVEVENLVPEPCRAASTVEEFFSFLEQEDSYFTDLLHGARSQGKRLCYIASFEAGKARVSLQQIDDTHAFYNLSGSDNIISFHSSRYKERPLVVKGPGAGAAVTAAGVFADIVRLGNARQ